MHKHQQTPPSCRRNEEAKEAATASLRAAARGSASGSSSGGSSDGGDEEREPPVEGVLSRPPLVSGVDGGVWVAAALVQLHFSHACAWLWWRCDPIAHHTGCCRRSSLGRGLLWYNVPLRKPCIDSFPPATELLQAEQPREGFVVVQDEGLLATSPTALLMSQQISLIQVSACGLYCLLNGRIQHLGHAGEWCRFCLHGVSLSLLSPCASRRR